MECPLQLGHKKLGIKRFVSRRLIHNAASAPVTVKAGLL
jgi:hypothetical protein